MEAQSAQLAPVIALHRAPANVVWVDFGRRGRRRDRTRRAAVASALVVAAIAVVAAAPPAPAAPPARAPSAAAADRVVVEPGDTLWAIAAEHAPVGSDPRAYVIRIRERNGLRGETIAPWTVLLLP